MSAATDNAWAQAKGKYQLHNIIATARTTARTGSCAAKITYGGIGWLPLVRDERVAIVNVMDDGTWSEVRPATAIRQDTTETVEGIPCSGGTIGILCSDDIHALITLSESAALIQEQDKNAELTSALAGSKTSGDISGAIQALAIAAVVIAGTVAVAKLAPIIQKALK